MRQFLSSRFAVFALGMGLFGWLVFTGPATVDQAKSAPLAADTLHLPIVSRDFSWRLARLNQYRGLAGLPALTEDPPLSDGAYLHARYMVKTDQVVSSEDPVAYAQWFTTEGNAAAANSLILGANDASYSDAQALDYWMRSPFQALSILDPELRQTGFGSYREADGGVQMGAVLDVKSRWQAGAPPGVTFPVMWPANGKTVNLRTYSLQDYPDPLAAPNCQSSFQGLPIILQLGDGSLVNEHLAAVDPTMISTGTGPLPHCAFSTAEYPATPSDNNYGKVLLDTRDAIILMPQPALEQGRTYTVSVTAVVNNAPVTYTWAFTIAVDANP